MNEPFSFSRRIFSRRCTSTYGRVLIPLVPMFETLHLMHYGRLLGHKIIQH